MTPRIPPKSEPEQKCPTCGNTEADWGCCSNAFHIPSSIPHPEEKEMTSRRSTWDGPRKIKSKNHEPASNPLQEQIVTTALTNYAPELRADFIAEITEAVTHAYDKHGDEQWGRHEFYAILKEEIDELWDAIKGDLSQEEVRAELVQVACVCLRYFETGDRYRETLRPALATPSSARQGIEGSGR